MAVKIDKQWSAVDSMQQTVINILNHRFKSFVSDFIFLLHLLISVMYNTLRRSDALTVFWARDQQMN